MLYQTVKTLWAVIESSVIYNDILCRQRKEPKTVFQAVVLKSERRNILTQYHDNRTSVHMGSERLKQKLEMDISGQEFRPI